MPNIFNHRANQSHRGSLTYKKQRWKFKKKRKKVYLDHLVPATGDNNGVVAVGGEADTGHPLGVALIL